jgi:hypothetical protein
MTITEAMKAVDRMSILKYFPTAQVAKEEIADMLVQMIQTDQWGDERDKLNWLVKAMRDNVGEWPGPAELRAVYCCKFKPSDGINAYSSLPGFSGEDQEDGRQASCLSAPVDQSYLPAPDDEPIGADFMKQIETLAKAKRIGGARR